MMTKTVLRSIASVAFSKAAAAAAADGDAEELSKERGFPWPVGKV